MNRVFVGAAMMAAVVASAEAAPRCSPLANSAVAKKAITAALADEANPVRVAYEAFLTTHADGVESRYNTLTPGGRTAAAEWYRRPVENKWVQLVPLGTSRGTEGTDKEHATETCVDEYLGIVSVPVELKWHGQHLVFEAVIGVSNGTTKSTTIKPLQIAKQTL